MAGLKGSHGPLKAGLHAILLAGTAASSPPAPTASITSAVPSAGTVGVAISGLAYTSANVATLYLAVIQGGTQINRTALPGTSGTLPSYTPSGAGNDQFALYGVASGGTALYTSPVIAVAAAPVETLVLNPASGSVTSGATFALSGTLSNISAQPALSVSVDGGAFIAMSAASPYLLSFTPSTGAPTGFTFTGQALSTGSHTIQVQDTTHGLSSNTITLTAAAPAQAGGTTAPGSVPAFRVQAVQAMTANMPITLGHFFKQGDVPAGSLQKLTATVSGHTVPVQVDQTNTWLADGSLRFAALSFLAPIALGAAGSVSTFQLGVGAPAMSTTGAAPAQIAAASNIQVKVSGSAYGSDTFTVAANDVLANLGNDNVTSTISNSPVGGWEMIRSGPICTEYRVWRMLKRDSDGASHRWVKCKIYLRAWSDGQGGIQAFEPMVGLFAENSYGPHANGSVGVTGQPVPLAGNTALYTGSTQIVNFTGGAPEGATPMVHQQRGWWGANSDGSRPWIAASGAAKPSYMVAHDQNYAISTKCLPPYDVAGAQTLAQAGVNLNMTTSTPGYGTYQINVSTFSDQLDGGAASINATGDASTDARYGLPLNCNAAALFLNPLDWNRHVSVLADGLAWADWECWFCDERSGWPVNTSSGTNPLACPSPANGTFSVISVNSRYGSPAWVGPGDTSYGATYKATYNGQINTYHGFEYGPFWDTSHTPSMWIMPLLRTGDAIYEETAIHQQVASFAMMDQYRNLPNFTINGNTYDYENLVLFEACSGERSQAHNLRGLGNVSRMLRDNHPMMGVIRQSLASNAKWASNQPYCPIAGGNTQTPNPAIYQWGILYDNQANQVGPQDYSGNNPFPHLFMIYDLQAILVIEEMVGEYPGWRTMIDAQAPMCADFFSASTGGSSHSIDVYNLAVSDGTNVFTSWSQIRQQSNNSDCGAASFPGGVWPSSGFYSGADGSSSQERFAGVCINIQGFLSNPRAGVIATAQELRNRYKATTAGVASVYPYMDGKGHMSGNFTPQFAHGAPPGVS